LFGVWFFISILKLYQNARRPSTFGCGAAALCNISYQLMSRDTQYLTLRQAADYLCAPLRVRGLSLTQGQALQNLPVA
jgi:hypothetical protein